jgi:hypothetical protein
MRTDDPDAARLVAAVDPELRAIAERCLRRERPFSTLQPTALVHEAYLKLVHQHRACWQNRTQFFAGLSTAEVLGMSASTLERDWDVTRGWLYRVLATGAGDEH